MIFMCVCVCFKQAVLEAQMKVEQQSTEGVAGILASIDESGPTGWSHDIYIYIYIYMYI